MPAIMTHDFFGRDAQPIAAAHAEILTTDERDAFLLGNQGPDPLFYLVADLHAPKRDHVGSLMHHDRPARLLASMHDALDMLTPDDVPVAQAYVAGFLCHYLLDSSMHPLVYFYQYGICGAGVDGLGPEDGIYVHAEVERDYDEMVLYSKRHETVREYRPYERVLLASDDVLAIIDKLFFYANLWTYSRTLTQDAFTRGVKSFRRIQHLFYDPSGVGRAVLGPVERLAAREPYSLYCAMAHRDRAEDVSDFDNRAHREWEDPFTHERSHDSFWDIYHHALDRVDEAERAFMRPGFTLEDARKLTGDLNFSGEVSLPDAPVEDAAC